jgi:parallel beta-helix repeat protein
MSISASNVILDCQGHTIDGVDADGTYGIYVYRSGITTTNITIKNCILSGWAVAGIKMYNGTNNQIINSTFNSNAHGIYLVLNSNNTIINSTFLNNYGIGIYFDYSSNNNIIISSTFLNNFLGIYLSSYCNNNIIINSTFNFNGAGINLDSSSNNQIINSTFLNNDEGIGLSRSSNNQIINSTFLNNYGGIDLSRSSNNNTIINSIFLNNDDDGVTLESSDYNKFENIYLSSFEDSSGNGIFYISGSNYNNITNITIANASASGFYIDFSNNNTISYSKIMNCGDYGIYLYSSQDNLIYNNLFNNTNNFYFDEDIYVNNWNTTRQTGTRIYSAGTEIGGNYWTNPTGNGYSDTCTDADKDGFCDDPYVLANDNVDYLALSDEYPPPPTTTTLPPVHGVPLLSSTLVGMVIGFGIIIFMLRMLFDIREPKKVIEYFIVLAVIVLTVISLIVLFA